jgi:3-deoxy-manno-octulosonate cytidylyltransferase (CMP-KDO synthetase)
MIENQRIACVIPARLASTRFPKKMLSLLAGRPLLEHVWEAASAIEIFDEVLFAVDSVEVESLVKSFGGKAFMTSPDCLNGTERLVELQARGLVTADIWVCWQGDEPFITRAMIEDLLQTAHVTETDLWTLKKKLPSSLEAQPPSTVKVVSDEQGRALYFSRLPIPYSRDGEEEPTYYKHIGIYAYRDAALKKISTLSPTPLELTEKLEQLRWLEHGLKINVHETHHEAIGIDLPEHLALAEQKLR